MIVEIKEVLCTPNVHIVTNLEGKPKRLHKIDINTLGQFRSAFLLDNIASNTRKYDIPMKRVQLIYAIIKGLLIDIGYTLSQDIFSMASKKSSPLGLSALIITLCEKRYGCDCRLDPTFY